MSADAADLDNDGRDELYIAQIAMGTVSQMAKSLAAPVGSCEIYPDIAERSRCDVAARFQLASIDARNRNDIEPCLQLRDPLQQRDCVVTAHHWFRVLVRLPALGGDKAKVMEECALIPRDFSTLHDVCGTIARSEMDHEQSDVTFADEPGDGAPLERPPRRSLDRERPYVVGDPRRPGRRAGWERRQDQAIEFFLCGGEQGGIRVRRPEIRAHVDIPIIDPRQDRVLGDVGGRLRFPARADPRVEDV